MNRFKKIFVIVMDSLGVGQAANAHLYGDAGSDTLAILLKTII